MPGQLRKNANCPQCGKRLAALVDTTTSHRLGQSVTREYFHMNQTAACTTLFTSPRRAQKERNSLEVPQVEPKP